MFVSLSPGLGEALQEVRRRVGFQTAQGHQGAVVRLTSRCGEGFEKGAGECSQHIGNMWIDEI